VETFVKMWINQVFTALHFFSAVDKNDFDFLV